MAYSLKNITDSELFNYNYYLTINIHNICRICLDKGGKLLPIFDPIKPSHFSDLIMACASVQIVEGDGMPTHICQKCIVKLNVAFQFKSQCETSDAKLRLHFTNFSTRADLTSYADIKKDNDIVYTLAANTEENILEVPVMDNMPSQRVQTNCLNNQQLQEIETQHIQTVRELHNSFPELKTTEIAGIIKEEDLQQLDLVVTTTPIGSQDCTINNMQTVSDQSRNIVESASITTTQSNIERRIRFMGKTRKSMKQHQCDLCGKIFRTKPSLVHHIRIHTGERPFVCHLCEKRFINGGHLHTHMRTHTGEKKHACPMCPKAFATAQQLTKHTIAIHTMERPYTCTYCPKRFASSSNLGTHVKIHTGEKNYRCDKCAKAFATKGQLFQHMLVHTGEKAFLCEYCNKRFSQKAHLVRHLKMHGNGM